MFNHHFFNGSASFDVYLRFIRDPSHCPNDLLVVLDPPFGGLVDVLALSLLRIGQDFIDDQMPSMAERLCYIFLNFICFYSCFGETKMASNNKNGIRHLRALVPWLMMMMLL